MKALLQGIKNAISLLALCPQKNFWPEILKGGFHSHNIIILCLRSLLIQSFLKTKFYAPPSRGALRELYNFHRIKLFAAFKSATKHHSRDSFQNIFWKVPKCIKIWARAKSWERLRKWGFLVTICVGNKRQIEEQREESRRTAERQKSQMEEETRGLSESRRDLPEKQRHPELWRLLFRAFRAGRSSRSRSSMHFW